MRTKFDGFFLLSAATGAGFSAYLVGTTHSGSAAGCPLGNGCEIVLSSNIASVAGIPIASIGLLYFCSIGINLWNAIPKAREADLAYWISLAYVLGAVCLTAHSIFVSRAFCALCLFVHVLGALTLGWSVWGSMQPPKIKVDGLILCVFATLSGFAISLREGEIAAQRLQAFAQRDFSEYLIDPRKNDSAEVWFMDGNCSPSRKLLTSSIGKERTRIIRVMGTETSGMTIEQWDAYFKRYSVKWSATAVSGDLLRLQLAQVKRLPVGYSVANKQVEAWLSFRSDGAIQRRSLPR